MDLDRGAAAPAPTGARRHRFLLRGTPAGASFSFGAPDEAPGDGVKEAEKKKKEGGGDVVGLQLWSIGARARRRIGGGLLRPGRQTRRRGGWGQGG